jgi:hypothetical protein
VKFLAVKGKLNDSSRRMERKDSFKKKKWREGGNI